MTKIIFTATVMKLHRKDVGLGSPSKREAICGPRVALCSSSCSEPCFRGLPTLAEPFPLACLDGSAVGFPFSFRNWSVPAADRPLRAKNAR